MVQRQISLHQSVVEGLKATGGVREGGCLGEGCEPFPTTHIARISLVALVRSASEVGPRSKERGGAQVRMS